ncbi:MAG: CBS domain-containing protein [Candidatus Omnitrophica bacterium]|nr:CBS domain-containing protein [Candidatus Omnitrophota bacterium]
MQVKEVMSRDIKSILPDMNAKEALKVLIENDMSGLPVIDETGKLVGVFTEREVLKAILPVYVKDVGAFVYAGESKAELKKLALLEKFLVGDIMRKYVPTINADASLAEASKIMLMKSERRVVVMEDGRPVGVITRSDVVRALAQQAGVTL